MIGRSATLAAAVLLACAARAANPEADAALADVRVPMCRAVIREMHIEIHKHALRKNGEDDIYETVPAICLAIIQNYTLSSTPAPHNTWTLTKRTVKLDDDDDAAPSDFVNLMTLKQVCELFTEEHQQELSEMMYRATMSESAETIVGEFCARDEIVRVRKPKQPKRRKASSEVGGGSTAGSSGGDGAT